MVLYKKQRCYGFLKDEIEMKRSPFIMLLPLLATSSILMISGVLGMTEYLRLQIDELRSLYEDAAAGKAEDVDRSTVEKLIFSRLQEQRKEESEQTTRNPYYFARNSSLFPPRGETGVMAKPLAHLTGSPTLRYTRADGTGLTKVTDWETRQGLATLANGMMYNNGDLIIPHDGFYYVYSQVYYRFLLDKQSTGRAARPYQMVHYVFLKQTSYPDPQEILKSVRSGCWSKEAEFGLYTSFQGGVFRFQRGDRIWVACSNLHLVSLGETESFFGAFMV